MLSIDMQLAVVGKLEHRKTPIRFSSDVNFFLFQVGSALRLYEIATQGLFNILTNLDSLTVRSYYFCEEDVRLNALNPDLLKSKPSYLTRTIIRPSS
jgi:hypothetical protein